MELIEKENKSEKEAFIICENEFQNEINEFEKELKSSGGNIVEEARHNMMNTLQKREAIVHKKRVQHHYRLYRKLRKMDQAEEILGRLNTDEGQEPLAIRQTKSRVKTLADFEIEDIGMRDKHLFLDVLKHFKGDLSRMNAPTAIKAEDLKFDSLPRPTRGRAKLKKHAFEK